MTCGNAKEAPLGKALISVEEAWSRLVALNFGWGAASVPLEQAAGRILRQNLGAARPMPPFDRAMMDGVLVAADSTEEIREWRLAGELMAGCERSGGPGSGQCWRVATGAAVPPGNWRILPVEWLELAGERAVLRPDAPRVDTRFIEPTGAVAAAGAELLRPGVRIGGPEMALLASEGVKSVLVAAEPRIVIRATGDELRDEPGKATIRPSNAAALRASLTNAGYPAATGAVLPDDAAAIRHRLETDLAETDVLILTGGVSMGDRDHVPEVLRALLGEPVFHGVAQRPGKPMGVWSGGGATVFALPGNPLSCLTCLHRYVIPWLNLAAGLEPKIRTRRLAQPVQPLERLTWFLPVAECDATGTAEPRVPVNSGDLVTPARATGFVELPPGRAVDAPEDLRYFAWS